MGDNLISNGTTVLLAIVSLGIIATLVSNNANTSGVINAGARGFSAALNAAEGPVLGNFGGSSGYGSAGYQSY